MIKKTFLLVLFSAVTFLLLNSFVSVNLFDGVVAEPISVNESTPFPLTGKVTVYGAKGGHKQAVGEISYTATIEVKETERETYSIVTVRLNNLCKYDV